MEKNIIPRGCCVELKPSATVSGPPFRGSGPLLLQEVRANPQAEHDPENADELGKQMQNPKSMFTSNKSPAILQLTAVRILTCYGVGTDQYS